jgi:hypothetical protein
VRIVTVCEEGLNRSVAAKWLLQWRNEVIAIGTARTSPDTLAMLWSWADRVILLDASLKPQPPIPPAKLVLWDVGPDRWPRPMHPDLVSILRRHGAATEWPKD